MARLCYQTPSPRDYVAQFRRDTRWGSGSKAWPQHGYPEMPGEPPRVQPSKKVAAHWDEQGNPA